MKTMRSFLLGMSAVFITPSVWAAGFQLNEFSVAAQGRANAGEPAMADTAAAIARNSAAMGNFDKASLSVVYHYIDPKVNVKGYNTTPTVRADKKGIAPSASVPGLYYVHPVNDQLALGLSLNSYFGLSTEYKSSFAASELANETSVKTYYFTPHISYKPVESLSLGLGINYIYGEGKIKNTFSNLAANPFAPAGSTLLDLDGDGEAVGYTLGLLWNADENTRVGFRYQSSVDLKLKGKVKQFQASTFTVLNTKGNLTLNLPEVYELGLAHDFGDKFTVLAGLQKTGWHSFKELKGDIKGVGKTQLKEEKWKDAYRLSFGAEWHVIETLTLRGGAGYDESPVEDQYRSLSIPDAARTWLTGGATVRMGDAGSLDFAVSYLHGGKEAVNEASKVGTTFKGGLSKTDAFIYSVGYNISF